MIVVGSLAAGFLGALVLVTAPLVPTNQIALTGGLMLGLALGWAFLAALSTRLTDEPQRWAAAPAGFFGLVGGLLLITPSPQVLALLGWVWPPALLVLVVWAFLQVRRQLSSRGARWLLFPVLAALAVAAVGGGYETVREFLDAKAYSAPGQLVDVGGRRLHLYCVGSGNPTVVLEPGLGGASSDLAWITPAVAQDTRVCVYDRAGRGWSDAAAGPLDATQSAGDLHRLLDRAHVTGPYVLAGHSFGGLYVQTFAARYPAEVAGVVLLDSTAPEPGPAPPAGTESSGAVVRLATVMPAIAHLGAGRLLAQASNDTLPPRSRDEARANSSTARYLASYIEEFLAGSASVRQAASLSTLEDKPLIVLTADTGHDAGWQAAQTHMAELSTNSLHRVARASHSSLLGDEAHSAAASRAIRDVVASVRTSRPLG